MTWIEYQIFVGKLLSERFAYTAKGRLVYNPAWLEPDTKEIAP